MRNVILFIIFFHSVVFAQKSDVVKSNTYVSPIITGDIKNGKESLTESVGLKNTVVDTLFGSQTAPFKNDGLSWPPLPRFWGTEGFTDYKEAKIGVGLPAKLSPFILERMHTFRYEVTVNFHYLGSLKMVNRHSDKSVTHLADLMLMPYEFEKIFEKDYVTSQEFFRVTEQNPIIGMCQYELALYYGKSTTGGVSFSLKSIVEGGRVDYAKLSVYSRMFNLKSRGANDEYTSRWYLDNECADRFTKYVKPFVDEEFAFKARQFHALYHPMNTCKPVKRVPNQTEKDCQQWHESFWSKTKKQNTVGRCEMQYNGENHCVLKAKEGGRCPLYYIDGLDSAEFNFSYLAQRKIPPQRPMSPIDQGPYALATAGVKEYPCDVGLVCTMDSRTTATCKKIKSGKQQ